MERFLWVGIAGALGTCTRYLIGEASKQITTKFPIGTIAVNVVGCFLIAFVMHAVATKTLTSETARYAMVTGFLGGLTTYSAFNYETSAFVRDGKWSLAIANFALTTVLCLAAGALGLFAARRAFE